MSRNFNRYQVQREIELLPSLRVIRSPTVTRVVAQMVLFSFITAATVLAFVPWRQNVVGSGSVIAFAPSERQQTIEAPIEGRVVNWHVLEGAKVKKGDLIVDIADNDPELPQRLRQERGALVNTRLASEQRSQSLDQRIVGLQAAWNSGVEAARARVSTAFDRIQAAEQALKSAEANWITSQLNWERTQKLTAKGLASTRQLELAELGKTSALADLDRSRAGLNAARNDHLSFEAELLRTDTESRARVDEARAAAASALSDVAKARADITRLDTRIARQDTQSIRAPVDGMVFRVLGRLSGQMLKSGTVLAVLIPESTQQVVELFMDGNDIPLIAPERQVRLQFEGWPAVQFAGWPSVAVGTFGGKVILVDAADNGQGKFRILVAPDPNDDPWPSNRYLRQGVRTNGWVLLNQVSLGYELWRQFNGFPPVISPSEPGASKSKEAQ